MKNRPIYTLIFAICLMISQIPLPAAAATSGTCGDKLTWSLFDDGVLTISGTGDMYDYDPYNSNPSPWNDSFHTVIVDEGVTGIGNYAFINSGLTRIQLPDTLKRLGEFAFAWSCLEELIVPDGITEIPEYLCYDNTGLKRVKLSANVELIGNSAFGFCENLVELEIPDRSIAFGYDALKAQYDAIRPELTLDTPVSTGIEIPNLYIQYFTFTPQQDGYYVFSSQGGCDTLG